MISALPTAFIVGASAALLLAVFALWNSIRAALDPTRYDVSAGDLLSTSRAALLDEKNALLRSIKDVEFERAVGKISEADFARFDADYRARAKEVMRKLDEDVAPYRKRAEQLIAEHLAKHGIAAEAPEQTSDEEPTTREKRVPSEKPVAAEKAAGSEGPSAEKSAIAEEAPASEDAAAPQEPAAEHEPATARTTCAKCETSNEPDAAFCKKCGAKMGEEVAHA